MVKIKVISIEERGMVLFRSLKPDQALVKLAQLPTMAAQPPSRLYVKTGCFKFPKTRGKLLVGGE